jgi:hypothetical protein
MTNKIIGFLSVLLFSVFIFSCTVDDSGVTENFINDSTDKICSESRTGGKGCFEFVFPITIVFADASTVEVASYEAMKAAFKTWKDANPSLKGKPSVQFPYSVTTEDGTVVTIENLDQLKALLLTCKKSHDGPKGGDHGKPCFTLSFPFSVTTSTGVVEVKTAEEFKALLKTLHKNKEKVSYVFPLTLILKDGTTKIVNTVEEIQAIKAACKKG